MVDRQAALEGLVINAGFWRGRKVFLTGHTGFKGGWTALVLRSLGAEVTGFSLRAGTSRWHLLCRASVCGRPALDWRYSRFPRAARGDR